MREEKKPKLPALPPEEAPPVEEDLAKTATIPPSVDVETEVPSPEEAPPDTFLPPEAHEPIVEESVLPEGLRPGDAVVLRDVDLPELPKPEPTVKLWIGTRRESPLQNVTVGGITFPAFLGPLQHDSKLEPILPKERGARIELTLSELDVVRERVSLRFVRTRGTGAPIVVSRASRYYKPTGQDVPLGKFIFMVVLGDRPPSYDWQETDPPGMWGE